MEKYQRPFVSILENRLSEPVYYLQLIAGPRRVGKTTAVQQVLKRRKQRHNSQASFEFHAVDGTDDAQTKSIRLDADEQTRNTKHLERDAQWLISTWQSAREKAKKWSEPAEKTMTEPYVLVLDEIQKIKNWSEVIKGLWDGDRSHDVPMHVVLLGSAPLLLLHGSSESLAGRYELIHATHWSYQEMKDAFDFGLDQFIFYGGYPGLADSKHTEKAFSVWKNLLKSHIEPSIQKDVLALSRIEKPALLEQLFFLGCTYSSQIVATTKLVGHLQDVGNATTITNYLKLLSYGGLLTGLPSFNAQALRQRAAPPKLQVLNTAFQTYYSGLDFTQARADHSHWGRLVESAIGAHLLNTASDDVEVRYWRQSPHEVDFVLRRGQNLLGIEVKSGKPKSLKGLAKFVATFQAKYPNVRTLLVGGSDESLALALSTPASEWFDMERF